MAEHTPGPWTWWTSNSWRRLKHDYRGHTVNVLEPTVCHDGQPDCIVNQSDMALIAAAPDMYTALLAVDDIFLPTDKIAEAETRLALGMVRRAIAKAEAAHE